MVDLPGYSRDPRKFYQYGGHESLVEDSDDQQLAQHGPLVQKQLAQLNCSLDSRERDRLELPPGVGVFLSFLLHAERDLFRHPESPCHRHRFLQAAHNCGIGAVPFHI